MKWISVKKKMPKEYTAVLATDGKVFDVVAWERDYDVFTPTLYGNYWAPRYRRTGHNMGPEIDLNKITHWAEIELPKKKESVMKLAKKAHKLAVKVSQYKTGKKK